MLRHLRIRDYLLIEELDLDLGSGLTIITGETGSGKSILRGALGLAMGDRADTAAMRDPSRRCVIELEADVSNLGLESWFTSHELPYEAATIIRRQLDPGGRSRAFINDTPVRLEQMRELGSRLVHIHSQHHTLLLNDASFQLGLLDHLAGQHAAVREHGVHHAAWRALSRELKELRELEAKARAESDYLAFQSSELDAAGLLSGEQVELEEQLSRADHADFQFLRWRDPQDREKFRSALCPGAAIQSDEA